MPEHQLFFEKRINKIQWADFKTAYGKADDVPSQLISLNSGSKETALRAAGELWSGLCHQHAYVSSASLPSYPFLLEILKTADIELSVEILDILTGFALCSHPKFPVETSEEMEWRMTLHQKLLGDALFFEELASSNHELVAYFAKTIVKFIRSEVL